MLPTRVPGVVREVASPVVPHVVLGSVDGSSDSFQAKLQVPETVDLARLERVLEALPAV